MRRKLCDLMWRVTSRHRYALQRVTSDQRGLRGPGEEQRPDDCDSDAHIDSCELVALGSVRVNLSVDAASADE